MSTDARSDWEQRIGQASGRAGTGAAPRLDPPTGLSAQARACPGHAGLGAGAGRDRLPGLRGRLRRRRAAAARPPRRRRPRGAAPAVRRHHRRRRPPTRWYAVCRAVRRRRRGPVRRVRVGDATRQPRRRRRVCPRRRRRRRSSSAPLPRPWRPMIGSEHLSHALEHRHHRRPPDRRRADAGAARRARRARRRHGARARHPLRRPRRSTARSTASRCTTSPVSTASTTTCCRWDSGRWWRSRSCRATSPPTRPRRSSTTARSSRRRKDWDRWYDLVHALVAHLVERYGLEEVRDRWSFEVWNEANLEVFWSGTPEEHWRLYDLSAPRGQGRAPRPAGRRSVVGRGRLGRRSCSPTSTASGAAVDFVSTHTYGSPPLDFRPALERHGRAGTPHLVDRVGCDADALQRGQRRGVLRGVPAAWHGIGDGPDRVALSYWVVSDHFEELGRPPALMHGGFGLRTVGELRKPRWWALALLERLGETRLPVAYAGDGGGSLVEALAARAATAPSACWPGTSRSTSPRPPATRASTGR